MNLKKPIALTMSAAMLLAALPTMNVCDVNCNIVGKYRIGGISSDISNNGIVENCTVSGAITGQSDIGGVVTNYYGTIRNTHVRADITGETSRIGGIGSQIYTALVENCSYEGRISVTGDGTYEPYQVGGFCGYTRGEYRNCYAICDIVAEGGQHIGGLLGQFDSNTEDVSNCFFIGTINGETNVGGICGQKYDNHTVLNFNNCYYNNEKFIGEPIGSGEEVQNCKGFTSAEFADGTVLKLLQAGCTESDGTKVSGDVWTQADGDAFPVLVEVERIKAPELKAFDVDGNGTIETGETAYELNDVEDLRWFGLQLAAYQKDVNAYLNADIVLNQNLLTDLLEIAEDGKATVKGDVCEWFYTHNSDYKYRSSYTGTFDGQGHTISGIYSWIDADGDTPSWIDDFGHDVSLFGTNDGVIRNLGIVDSYFAGKYSTYTYNGVGTIAGSMRYGGRIENCYVEAIVKGDRMVGGICSQTEYNSGNLTNCHFNGKIYAEKTFGAIVGSCLEPCFENCYFNSDLFSGDAIGVIEQIYEEDYDASEHAKGCTAEEFADGTVLKYLQAGFTAEDGTKISGDVWTQDTAKDAYPVLKMPESAPQVMLGDVDGNGKISISDVVLLQRYIGEEPVSISQDGLKASDCNHDGTLNGDDVTLILKFIARLIDTL